jgi:hypothetical protein
MQTGPQRERRHRVQVGRRELRGGLLADLGLDGRPRSLAVDVARQRRPALERDADRVELRANVLEEPEVRDREALGLPAGDEVDRRPPRLEVDVGRRRRRQHRSAVDAHAADVADEGHAGRLVQVGDVVGRVTRRVLDAPRAEALAAEQHAQALLRHGTISPHRRSMSSP